VPIRHRSSLLALLVGVCLTLIQPHSAVGQVSINAACPPEGCITGVAVTPDGGSISQQQNTGGLVTFLVQNTGNVSTPFTFTCSGAKATCGTVTPASFTILPGSFREVDVQYTSTTLNGRVTLTASNGGTATNQGYYNITVTNQAGPAAVAFRNQNGDNVDRSACLTTGAGESAAFQCGDLLIAHSLPGFTSMNKARALTLVYNSSQAAARVAVAVAVTEASTVTAPNSIFMRLSINGVPKDSASYTGWNSAPQTRQLTLVHDASGDSTGIYPFTLLVENRYTTGGSFGTTLTGNLIVVNRSQSRFGRGWSLAGVEQLVLNQPGGSILWVGGDGSAKSYSSVTATTWVAAPGGFRDTLTYNSAAATYTRVLRHGIQVTYDAQGRHIKTTNRTGQVTTFTWSVDTLKTITVPPAGAPNITYTLSYGSGLLDKITDPGSRVLDATISTSTRQLTSLLDPDNIVTGFSYDAAGRMTGRTNRRGFRTSYAYAYGLRLTRFAVPINPVVADSSVTSLSTWDEKGLPGLGSGDTANAYTVIQGPRVSVPDDAKIWVDRWGGPTKIVDPLGFTTTYAKGNPALPLLVTKVTFPDGRVDSLSYDGRGNLTQELDSTAHLGSPNATTRYAYADLNTKDSPSSVTDPEGVVTGYTYNTFGLTSQVTAPNGHLTKFSYVASGALTGLVKAITELQVPVWDSLSRTEKKDSLHTGFAFNTSGNVVSDTSPMNRVRRFTRDTKQRVTDSYDAGGHRTQFTYDPLDRLTATIQHVEQAGNAGFPADSGYTSALTTASHYDIDVLDQVTDPRNVIRRFQYDAANRQVGETDEFGATESRFYDRAGLLDSVRLRTGDVVRHTYDAAGRKSKTAWNGRDGLPADSVLFDYDNMGRMLTATTRNKRVTRTYNGTGNLATDLQDGSAQVTVSQAYGYDRAGKRQWHRIGPANDLLTADSVTYRYDAATGDLNTLAVRWRKRFTTDPTVNDSVRFWWDALGRRDTVLYSNGTKVKLAYDKDGSLRVLCGTHGTGASGDILNFTVAHQWIDQDGMIRSTTNTASAGLTGCGASGFISTEQNTYWWRHALRKQSRGSSSSSYVYDGSGNQTRRIDVGGTTYTFTDSMPVGTNRLAMHKNGSTWTVYSYDNAGRRLEEKPCSTSLGCVTNNVGYREYFYDGLGRTGGTNEFRCNSWDQSGGKCIGWGTQGSTFCGYDPLNRLTQPCEGGVLGYDGHAPVRTGADTDVTGWTFIQGPGVDDPLLAFSPWDAKYLFYVTDGAGRQYAVADRQGFDMLNDLTYTSHGPKFAGGTVNSSTFGAERFQQNTQPNLSFFRSRFYDQETGRWTQEDPIGVAGGTNLYQFNGNNPVMYTDPFGLVCNPPGSCILKGIAGGAVAGATMVATADAILALPTAGASAVTSPVTVTGGAIIGGAAGGLIGAGEELKDAANKAMGKISRAIGQIGIAIGAIFNPGGEISTGDHTATGTGVPATEAPPKGRKERKDEQEGGGPAAGE
jgi:RHS repeat-associated protein